MNCRVIQKNKVKLLNSVLWVLKLQFCFTLETFVHLNVSNTQVEWEELSLPENQTHERWRSINSLQRQRCRQSGFRRQWQASSC